MVVLRWAVYLAALVLVGSCLRPAAPPPSPPSPPCTERASCGAGDSLCLVFRNDMGASFEVRRLLVVLDGAVVFDRTQALSRCEQLVVYSGAASPGEHTEQLLLQMTRNGGYQYEARSSHAFDVAAGGPGPSRLITIAYEQPAAPLHERPAIRFLEEPSTPRPPVTTIWVSKSGTIELNGRPSDLQSVDKTLTDASKRRGIVVYGVDASDNEPNPNAKKVIELLARDGLVVRLSARRDFSDVVTADGKVKD